VDRVEELAEIHRDELAVGAGLFILGGVQADLLIRQELKRAGKFAYADFRSLQILEDADGGVQSLRDGADGLNSRGVLLVSPVRKIQAGDVHPRFDQRFERFF